MHSTSRPLTEKDVVSDIAPPPQYKHYNHLRSFTFCQICRTRAQIAFSGAVRGQSISQTPVYRSLSLPSAPSRRHEIRRLRQIEDGRAKPIRVARSERRALSSCSAEFLVEPFEVGHPGPHVTAAVDAVRRLGFDPVVGPFGTTIEGDPDKVIEAVKDLLDAATAAGASRVSLQIDTCGDE